MPEDLHFPNGITLTSYGSAMIFVETDSHRLSRLLVSGPKAGRRETLAENPPGFPGTVSRYKDGRLWIAMVNPRDRALDPRGAHVYCQR